MQQRLFGRRVLETRREYGWRLVQVFSALVFTSSVAWLQFAASRPWGRYSWSESVSSAPSGWLVFAAGAVSLAAFLIAPVIGHASPRSARGWR